MSFRTAIIPSGQFGTKQQFVEPGFGTPKGALFISTRGTLAGLRSEGHVLNFGLTDGSSQFSISSSDRDNVSTTQCQGVARNDSCITMLDPNSASIDGRAIFSQFVTDGIEIEWVNPPAVGWLTLCILFGGDINFHIGTFTKADTGGNSVFVNVPFELTQLLTFGNETQFNGTIDTTNYQSYFGLCDNGDTIQQRSISQGMVDNVSTSDIRHFISNEYIARKVDGPTGTRYGLEITDITPSGFEVTTQLQSFADLNPIDFMYLAIEFSGAKHSIVDIDNLGIVGVDDVFLGYQPQFAIGTVGNNDTLNTLITNNRSTLLGVNVFNNDIAYNLNVFSNDNFGTTDTFSYNNDQFLDAPDVNDVVPGNRATRIITNNGFQLDYSSANNTAKYFVMAVGVNQVSGQIDFTTQGAVLLNDNIDLIINGISNQSGSLDNFIGGHETISGSIDTLILSKDTINENINLFNIGHNNTSGNIDTFIVGSKLISSGLNQTIFGKDNFNKSIDLSIEGSILSSGNLDIFIDGLGYINNNINLSIRVIEQSSIDLIINGSTPRPTLSCPALDPTASIQISDDLINIYQTRIDALINQLGKNVILVYDPIKNPCPNCTFDNIRQRSTGIYIPGGPRPFPRGSRCPWCKGAGFEEIPVQKCIKALLQSNPRDAQNYGISIMDYNGIVRIKTFLTLLPDLVTANHAIVHNDISGIIKYKVKMIRSPVPTGLREDRYCISFWELIDG